MLALSETTSLVDLAFDTVLKAYDPKKSFNGVIYGLSLKFRFIDFFAIHRIV